MRGQSHYERVGDPNYRKRERKRSRATQRAYRELAARHQAEYRRILEDELLIEGYKPRSKKK